MELPNHSGPVTVMGGGRTSNFGIAMNAKAFRVLSDTLYKDKIGSMVRETACNGLDSHSAAGKSDIPLEIHLPDDFEPWYTIRDFGIGMSPETIETVFCIYFESTKDQSNDAIGAFGLGAKTPFAYTDQFTVTSIFNGVAYCYAIFIDGDGMPSKTLMSQYETTECNGVEIKIGVEKRDFQAFYNAVAKQLAFFPVKPIIKNYKNEFKFVNTGFDADSSFKNDKNIIYKSRYGSVNKIDIVQGPVAYPLESESIRPSLTQDEYKFLQVLWNCGASLFFNIGEIGVTASREAIEYKAHTINSIKKRLNELHDEVKAYLTKHIEDIETNYEKAKFVNKAHELRSLLSGVKLDLAPAERDMEGKYFFRIGGCDALCEDGNTYTVNGKVVTSRENIYNLIEYKYVKGEITSARNSNTSDKIYPDNNEIAVVIRDATPRPVAKIRHFMDKNGYSNVYSLTIKNSDFKVTPKVVDALRKHLGEFENIVVCSELPDPPRTAYERSRSDWSRPTCYLAPKNVTDMDSVANWHRISDKLSELEWKDEEVTEAIYVEAERQRVCNHNISSFESKRLYRTLNDAGMVDLPLFAIRTADIPKLKDSPINWITLNNYIARVRATIENSFSLRRYKIAQLAHTAIESAIGSRVTDWSGVNSRHPLVRLSRIRTKAEKIMSKSNVNYQIMNLISFDASKHPAITATHNATKQIWNNIPLAKHYLSNGWGTLSHEDSKHLKDYINHFSKLD